MTRNPDDLMFFTKYFVLCHESIVEAQQYKPEFLDDIINKSLKCIKKLRNPLNQLPLFNGGSENTLESFDKYLENLKIDKQFIVGKIFHAKSKQQELYLDIGSPPAKATKSFEKARPGITPPDLSFPYTNSSITLVGTGIPAEELAFFIAISILSR